MQKYKILRTLLALHFPFLKMKNHALLSFGLGSLLFAIGLLVGTLAYAATSYKTLTVTFTEHEDIPTMLNRGATVSVGKILLESEGGKVEVERIALELTGTADASDIRRAFLYNQFDALVSTGGINDNAIIFPGRNGIIVRDEAPVELDVVLEMGVAADIGKTFGFRLATTDSVYMREQDYEIREVADTFPMSITPIVISEAGLNAFVAAEFTEEPEYQDYFSIASQDAFATLRLQAFGGDVILDRVTIDLEGSLKDAFIKGATLRDENGDTVAGPVDAIGRQLIFTTPITLAANTSREIGIVLEIPWDAGEGDTLFFEIDDRTAFAATSQEQSIPIVAEAPFRSKSKKVYSSSMAFWTSWLNPKPRVLSAGEFDVTMLEFEAQSTTENAVMNRVEVDVNGATEALTNIRLIRKPGRLLGTIEAVTNGKVIFEDVDYTMEAGKIDNYLILADIADTVAQGKTVQVIVPRQEMIGETPTYGGPAIGSVYTLGARETVAALAVSITRPSQEIIAGSANVPIAKIGLEAIGGTVEVDSLTLQVDGTIESTVFRNYRLVDEYNRLLSSAAVAQNGTVVFSNPFPVVSGTSQEILLVADISASTGTSYLVEITSPEDIKATDLKKAKTAESTGNFPLKTRYVDLVAPPTTPYLKVNWLAQAGGDVMRASTAVELGSFTFSAYGRDARIERIALTQAGTVRDKLDNVVLLGENGHKVTGRASADVIVFDDPIRIPAESRKTYRFLTDFLITADVGSTFQVEIAGIEQIKAIGLGDPLQVVANYPLKGSRFDVIPMVKAVCPLQEIPVCARVYTECDEAKCPTTWQTFANQCLLDEAGAVYVYDGTCTTSASETDDNVAPPRAFSDVSPDSENAEAIDYIRSQGIVQGFDDGSYQPDKSIARAGFIKIVVEAKYSAEEIASCIDENSAASEYVFFPDVPAGEWFAPYICVAKVKEIIKGFPDGTFRPAKEVSFVEAAKIIANTFSDTELRDGETIWYEPYVIELESAAAIPLSIKAFDQLITRGEMAEIIYRIIEGITDRPTQQRDLPIGGER